MHAQTPLKDVGVYKAFLPRLEKLEIKTVEDLLFYFPFRYDDFSLISPIEKLQAGEIVTVMGTVSMIKNEYTRSRKTLQKARVVDDTGELDVLWFNQPYIVKMIHEGDKISLSGKIDKGQQHRLVMQSPEFELLTESNRTIHTGRLVPVYSETKGLSSKWLRRQIDKFLAIEQSMFKEYLPDELLKKENFMSLSESVRQIHFPESHEHAENARRRLAYDELLLLQLLAKQRRKEWQEQKSGVIFKTKEHEKKIKILLESLPFTLTQSQNKSIQEIFHDISFGKPMNRLLQGDVGSGKTVVAAIVMYIAFLNGFQSVLMAPTEILAEQHFQTIRNLLEKFGVKITLVTGSKKLSPLNSEFSILIGTHAVLSEKVHFANLGLVVIDEQQRFGVEQRSTIRKKGEDPHLLTMTATPIPRTIALTLYGDLDVSRLTDMPKGRTLVKTWLVPPEKRMSAYHWIETLIKETKGQVFIICPFIEESENMTTVKAATKEYDYLKKNIFKRNTVGLLHGKMKAAEKEKVLSDFKNKKFDILVATPVVEVGIDIPNAVLILIEASERFGLSQLHQLRGRVGRGDKQSYCLLFTESTSPQTRKRLQAMETTHIGSELAELDLQIRGSGDIFGTMQHGRNMLKVASFSDFSLIEKVNQEVESLFPRLSSFPRLSEKLTEMTVKEVAPD